MSIPLRLQPYLLAIAAIAGLAAFAAYDLVRERALSVDDAKTNTANIAKLLEEHTRQSLRHIEARLAAGEARLAELRAAADDRPLWPDHSAALTASLAGDDLINALLWLGPNDQPRASTSPSMAAPGEALTDWLARARNAAPNSVVLGRLWRDTSGQWRLLVGRRTTNRDGSPAGALVAMVDLGAIQRTFDAVDTGKNGFITLFRSDGWMLATAPRNDALIAKNWGDAPMFKEHLPRAATGTVQQVVVRDNTERVYSYRALADYPLVVSTGISMTDALDDWRARVGWDAALLGLAAVAALTGAAAMSRAQTRRESVARESAEAIRLSQASATQARHKAEHSERFLRAITDSLPIRIAYLDRDLRFRFVNKAHAERFGLTREAIIGHTRLELTAAPPVDQLQARFDLVLQGHEQRFEIDIVHEGRAQVAETYLVPDIAADGSVVGFYTAVADVTERHSQQRRLTQALAERETLLREVYHRVKNNLQVIQSLLNLQRRALPEGPARSALDDSMQRVQAMALVHEKLYQTGALDAVALREYVIDLLRHLGDATGAGQRQISLLAEIDAIQAALEVAVPFGLLITELVGNSLKHGFPDGRPGHIRVKLSRQDDQVWLSVRDDGVGLAPGFDINSTASMGLQLAASLAGQLGGQLQASNDGGAVFSVRLSRMA